MKTGLVAVAIAVFAASCGNDFSVPVRDGGGSGTDGGSGADASTVTDGAPGIDAGGGTSDAATSIVDAGTSDGPIFRDAGSCEYLRNQYDAAMARAKVCDPTASNSCSVTRKEHIDCGCQVPVSLANQQDLGMIDYLAMQWSLMNCMVGVNCPAIGCPATTVGTCVPSVNGGPAMCGRVTTP